MKVKELIEHLQTLDQEAPMYLCDGEWDYATEVTKPESGIIPWLLDENRRESTHGYYWSV